MNNLEKAKSLIEALSETEKAQLLSWLRSKLPKHEIEERLFCSSEELLEALARATELTVRMIRGVIAEAAFAASVLPALRDRWSEQKLAGDLPYDFLLCPSQDAPARFKESLPEGVRIQVKMQRSERGQPKIIRPPKTFGKASNSRLFVVEVQKTRTGEKNGHKTRPYRYGEFDILAVSLGPSTKNWSDFIYTLDSWLLSAPKDSKIIRTMQPIDIDDSRLWTRSLEECISWKVENRARPT